MSNSRALVVIIVIFLFFFALVYKLVDIQLIKSEELKYYAQRQQMSVEKIPAERGMIYDSKNVLLVYNRSDISFYLDLRMASNAGKEKIAERFASVFGRNKSHYQKLMSQSGKTICIERKAPSEKALLLKNFKIAGLFYEDDPTRVYHYDNLASHILGYVGDTYTGINGIERTFDKSLKGEEGSMLVVKNAIGDMITVAEEQTKASVPGDNIYLTINKSYQSILEEELKKGLADFGGTSSIGIIMDPNNGEILALANADDYNPNIYWKSNDTIRRNKAVTDTYEPGSTFKTITMAALLDQNLCREDEIVNTENGRYTFKNVRITDTHGFEKLTVKEVMEQSSNVGVSKLAQRIDSDLFYKYIRGFGFGNYTSAGLPGEVKGSLKKPNDWNQLTKAFVSFGYEISVTPIQLAAAYSAVINGGVLYQPQIVKRRVNRATGEVEEFNHKQIRRVISEGTSARMREILGAIVKTGTGKNASIKSIQIGGKTGTSQKLVDGKYSKAHYNSSFVGFFPADNPKVVCLILVNSPKVGRYGGLVAAPIFRNVADRIVSSNMDYFKSPIEGLESIPAEFKALQAERLNIKPAGNQTKRIENLSSFTNSSYMPDLKDYSLRDAIFILNKLELKYKINGTGKVVSQSIAAGEKIKKGMICKIDCEEITVTGTMVY